MSLVNQASLKERQYVEGMQMFEVIDRKMTEGCDVIRTRWVVTNWLGPGQGSVARSVYQKWLGDA